MELVNYHLFASRLNSTLNSLGRLYEKSSVAKKFYDQLNSYEPIGPPTRNLLLIKKVEVPSKLLQNITEAKHFLKSF
jgi:hypothetical protein|tara:strand:- start:5353 stop:5583 length:231 start_codon:yes stop_codon:yes gene_type:complete